MFAHYLIFNSKKFNLPNKSSTIIDDIPPIMKYHLQSAFLSQKMLHPNFTTPAVLITIINIFFHPLISSIGNSSNNLS